MQQLKVDHPDGFTPDAEWYRSFVAKMIVVPNGPKTSLRQRSFPAYQANIIAYTTALIADRMGPDLRYDVTWERQSVPINSKCYPFVDRHR